MKIFNRTIGIVVLILLFLCGVISMFIILIQYKKINQALILILMATYALVSIIIGDDINGN